MTILERKQTMNDDPISILKANHRADLDRQAELTIEARAVTARAETIGAELARLERNIRTAAAVLALVDRPARTLPAAAPAADLAAAPARRRRGSRDAATKVDET